MRLVRNHPILIPWFDEATAALGPSATTGPILDVPSFDADNVLVEIDPASLSRLLDWADAVPRFHPYLRSDTTSPDEWDAFIRRHVALFRGAGAGEIVLTSMDADGTKNGYDLPMTRAVADAVSIPLVASGGCGSPEHMRAALVEGGASAALAASIFHFREYTIAQAKDYLAGHGVAVRPTTRRQPPDG